MASKSDYSPVIEEPGSAEQRRGRRRLLSALAFSWGFLAFALVLAAIVLAVYLAAGF